MATAKHTPKQKKKKFNWRKAVVAGLAGLMALVMLLSVLLVGLQASASSTEVLEAEIAASQAAQTDLANQIKELETQLASIAGDKEQALEAKAIIDQQIIAKSLEIQNTESIILQYDALIAEEQANVDETIAQEEAQFELFCQRVRAMEEAGTVSYWSILFEASDFSDLLDRSAFVSEIMEADNKIMEDLQALRATLLTQMEALEASKTDQEVVMASLESQMAELEAKEAEAAALVQAITDEESEYESSRLALEREEAAVEAEIIQKQAELEASIASGQVSFDPGTGWQWPMPGQYTITSTFGPRIHPITGVAGNHTGTDISAPKNTPILSAQGGVVTISTYNSSYGNYVVVQHENGISTLYAHMTSRAVSEGQVVSQGETLGYVGSTGSSTGNHLHFEFRINGVRADALDYYPSISFTYR